MSSINQSNMNTSLNTSKRSSLLFSNRTLNDSMASRQSREDSLISTNRFKSPFYEGKVSFGGSSAKRVRLSQVLPYNLATKPSNVTRIKDSDKKRLKEFDQLSSASRNMLQNIYKASSPLEDAKKIPVFDLSAKSVKERYLIDTNARPFKRLSGLRTPKLLPSANTFSPLDREKLQLKWEENTYELPSVAVPLPIEDISTLKFSLTNSNVNSNKTSTSNKRPFVSITYDEDSSEAFEEFKFSAPKAIKLAKISDSFVKDSIRNNQLLKSSSTSSNSPSNTISSDNKPNVNQEKNNSSTIKSTPSSLTKLTTVTTSTSSNLMNLETNKTVGMYKVDKLDTGDFNPKENKATLANTNLPIKTTVDNKLTNSFNYDGLNIDKTAFLPSSKKWDCDVCSVKNELSSTKCAACETPRVKECKDKNVNNIYSNYSFGTINTEKKGFNAFKLADLKSTPPSIVSTNNNNNNSILSTVLSTVNSTSAPTTTPSLSNKTESTVNEDKTKSSSNFDFVASIAKSSLNNGELFNFIDSQQPSSTTSFFSSSITTKNNSTLSNVLSTVNSTSAPVTTSLPANKTESTVNEDKTKQSSGFVFGISASTTAPSLANKTESTANEDKSKPSSNFVFGTSAPIKTPSLSDKTESKVNEDKSKPSSNFVFGTSAPIKTPSLSNKTESTVNETKTKPSSGFVFGISAPVTAPSLSNKAESTASEDKTKASSNFVFGSSLANSSLNNKKLFNLNNTQQSSSTTSFFSSSTTTNNNSTAPNLTSFGNQFGSKTQFGQNLASTNASSNNIFSSPNNLTNGFGSSTTSPNTNNLFSGASSVADSQQPPLTNFSTVFSATPSFNFGAAAASLAGNNQPAQNSVFQFSAPASDTSIGQSGLPINNLHGRFIKKAKRRLGSKD